MRQRMTVRREVYCMADKKKDKKVSYESQESLYKKAVAKMNADEVIVLHQYRIDNDLLAASMFDDVGDYLDAPDLAQECRRRAQQARADEKVYIYKTATRREKEAEDVSEWEKVAEQYESLGDYKDAAERAEKCRVTVRKLQGKSRAKKYTGLTVVILLAAALLTGKITGFTDYMMGFAYMKAGVYASAADIFEKMPGFLKADRYHQLCEEMRVVTGKPGNEVAYGQSRWKILSIDGSVYTMIASAVGEQHIFYHVPFNKEGGETTWADSSLRAWLNGEILETLFNEEERSRLLVQTSAPTENPLYGTAYTQETQDYLTLPSIEDAEQYANLFKALGNECWLRTPGKGMDSAAFLSGAHVVRTYGADVSDDQMLARAMIKVDFSDLM